MRIKQITVLLTVLAVILSGCQFGMIETVQIKADPTVQFALGTRANVFSEFVDIDGEIENIIDTMEGLNRDTSVATGDPVSLTYQRNMIDQSLTDLAGTSLQLNDINQSIPAAGDPAIEFSIPAISENEPVSLTIDPLAIPTDVTLPDTTISGLIQVNGAASTPEETVNAGTFTSVTFTDGTLTCTTALSNVSSASTPDVTIDAAYLYQVGTTTAIATAPSTVVGSPLVFNFGSNSLPSSFDIVMDVTVDNGAGLGETYDLVLTFPGTETISAAEGITVDTTISDSITITQSNTDLQAAVIDTGSIDIDLDTSTVLPGVTPNINMTLGKDTPEEVSSGDVPIVEDPEWNLNGVTIGSGNITLDYTLKLYATNASFVAGTVTGNAIADISKFTTVELDSTYVDLGQEMYKDLNQDIINLVDSFTFGSEAKVVVAMTNNLPVNLELSIDAPDLGILPGDTFTYPGKFSSTDNGEISNPWEILPLTSPKTVTISSLTDSAEDAGTNPDFAITVTMDDGDGDDSILTLSDVEVNTTYSFEGSVAATLPIDSVEINGDPTNPMMSGQYPESGDPLDFSQLGDFLPDSIELNGITANLNLAIPEGSGLNLGLMAWATYTDSAGDPQAIVIQGTETGTPDGIPDVKEDYDQTTLEALNNNISFGAMETLVNERASNIVLYYEIYVDGASIDLTAAAGDQNFTANIEAILPLSLYAEYNASIEMDNEPIIPAATSDLFNRDGTEDDDLIETWLDQINSAEVTVRLTTPDTLPNVGLLGIGFTMKETTNPTDFGNFTIQEEITLSGNDTETLTLSISESQLERMIADDSFEPVYDIYLIGEYTDDTLTEPTGYDGLHQLVEGFDLDVEAFLRVQSNIDGDLEELTGGNL